ncbi:MAG: DUF1538 domain-containing protein [Erysipelotrichales bacterium]|nr:DUF1538 domain-containing protein [Erysipelotrichales bacterium]
MIKQLFAKFIESLKSILPITLLVIILNFTPIINLSSKEIIVFLVSAIFLIIGMSLFNIGAEIAMTPMGEQVGTGLTKTKSLWIVLLVCFLLGLFITIAEPDLTVLAGQVKDVINSSLLIATVGAGVGLFLVLAIVRIVGRTHLSMVLMYSYLILFALASVVLVSGNESLIALSFDSGGVTTGPITVPFIMALGVGIASVLGGKNSNENSFGIVAMCSVGSVLAVLILGIFIKGDINYTLPSYTLEGNIFPFILNNLLTTIKDVSISLGLVVVFFFIVQSICLKLPRRKLLRIGIGIIYTYFGLIIFLTAANTGFITVGYNLGEQLARSNKTVLIIVAFIIGLLVVLAEPAVHVLNSQVENLTEGQVKKSSVLIALSVGVGASICLSVVRIIFDFSVLYYLIPGYILSLGLSFFVPRLYTAIAFDSGGVASGPMTSTFILPFAIGACMVLQGEEKILQDAFGIVAMVAMTPLITIQLLGFRATMASIVKKRIAMRRIVEADDEQIIDFM